MQGTKKTSFSVLHLHIEESEQILRCWWISERQTSSRCLALICCRRTRPLWWTPILPIWGFLGLFEFIIIISFIWFQSFFFFLIFFSPFVQPFGGYWLVPNWTGQSTALEQKNKVNKGRTTKYLKIKKDALLKRFTMSLLCTGTSSYFPGTNGRWFFTFSWVTSLPWR